MKTIAALFLLVLEFRSAAAKAPCPGRAEAKGRIWLFLTMLIHPIRNFTQPLEAVHWLAAAGQFMIFPLEQASSGFNIQDFQRRKHFHCLGYSAGIILKGMNKQRWRFTEIRIFQRRMIPHFFHLIPWLAAVMQIIIIADA